MAIFKPPKITSEKRALIALEKGELVFDETNNKFYTGDGNTVGGIEIVGNGGSVSVPTKLSDLQNDCNFISGYTENDALFAALSGNFALKSELPTVPIKISDLTNDVNFLTGYVETDPIFVAVSANFAIKDETPTKADLSAAYASINELTDTVHGKQAKITESNKLSYELISGAPAVAENEDIVVSSTITDNTNTDRNVYAKLTSMSFELTADSVFGSSKLPSTEFDNKMFLVNVGIDNTISGFATTVIGKGNTAIGAYATTIGYGNFVTEAAGFAHGHNNRVEAGYGHAEGQSTKVLASYGHSEGCGPIVSGQWAHAEGGEGAIAGGEKSHAEGKGHALGEISHAEGLYASASGTASHAEGNSSSATGTVSHAEGISTNASGEGAHTEGLTTWAAGKAAHAEGYATHADFEAAHAEGNYTSVAEKYQHVEGAYNVPLTGYQHIVGGGDAENGRKNIQTLDWYGNLWTAGTVSTNDIIFNGDAQTLLEKLAAMEARIIELEEKTSGAFRTEEP